MIWERNNLSGNFECNREIGPIVEQCLNFDTDVLVSVVLLQCLSLALPRKCCYSTLIILYFHLYWESFSGIVSVSENSGLQLTCFSHHNAKSPKWHQAIPDQN